MPIPSEEGADIVDRSTSMKKETRKGTVKNKRASVNVHFGLVWYPWRFPFCGHVTSNLLLLRDICGIPYDVRKRPTSTHAQLSYAQCAGGMCFHSIRAPHHSSH